MKAILVAIILLITVLFCACSDTAQTPSKETTASTEEITTEAPTEVPVETEPDPFGNIRESKETWLAYGLSAYENRKEPENLKEFFADGANMTYLTLYEHMFTFDSETSISVAEALFAFICDEYGVDALLDVEKRCAYKTAYLRSLGLDTEYVQLPEVEAFFNGMEFSSNATYPYIIAFDNVTYYFKDFGAGSPAQYHGFLYFSTTGLFEMIEYMKDNHVSDGLDTEREFNYYMTFDGSGYSKTLYANGDMYINESYSTLHEAVHAMGIGMKEKDNIWLSEGICNYFGRSLGFNDQIAASYIQILTMVQQGYFDDLINKGDASAILRKAVYDGYVNGGGRLDSADAFDFRLYSDVTARVELNSGSYVTLGEAYEIANKTAIESVGDEISYEQSTSLILYLVDTYGIDKVLEAYHTQDIVGAFGKGYEELKADWLGYLNP